MDNNTTINDILVKAIRGESLDTNEQVLLDAWLADKENHDLFLKWKNEHYSKEKLKEIHEIDSLALKTLIDQKINTPGKVIFLRRNWIQYAAAAILLFAGTAYYLIHKQKPSIVPGNDATNVAVTQNDIKPGSSKAVLTLADGRKIVLDSAGTGKLADQGNAVITNQKGQLVYTAVNQSPSEVQYNTLTTARGEIYSIQLSEGTIVTLNSSSSIRYPLVFTGNERKVEISGEAFF